MRNYKSIFPGLKVCLSSIHKATIGLLKPTSTVAIKSLDTGMKTILASFYLVVW